MKWNYISGQWTRFQEKAKEEWGELTDSELIEVNGRFDVLAKKIQDKYGVAKEEASRQIDMWTANLEV
ncbi:MAG: CsbD family protein [Anaerolineae bacterium]|nr:CsbD family protein [Anaerolineae bacterium]